ncbi:unnamed protein product [Lupinus luteus]|uniref:Uncharacterized protein n=1 Tax=Lupinus luteus TaxID=3873 RepID=A0AAV1WFW5_LUPLU
MARRYVNKLEKAIELLHKIIFYGLRRLPSNPLPPIRRYSRSLLLASKVQPPAELEQALHDSEKEGGWMKQYPGSVGINTSILPLLLVLLSPFYDHRRWDRGRLSSITVGAVGSIETGAVSLWRFKSLIRVKASCLLAAQLDKDFDVDERESIFFRYPHN